MMMHDENHKTERDQAIDLIQEVYGLFHRADESLINEVIKWLREGKTHEEIINIIRRRKEEHETPNSDKPNRYPQPGD